MSTLTRLDFVKVGAMDGFFVTCDRCKGRKHLEDMTLCPKCDGIGALFICDISRSAWHRFWNWLVGLFSR